LVVFIEHPASRPALGAIEPVGPRAGFGGPPDARRALREEPAHEQRHQALADALPFLVRVDEQGPDRSIAARREREVHDAAFAFGDPAVAQLVAFSFTSRRMRCMAGMSSAVALRNVGREIIVRLSPCSSARPRRADEGTRDGRGRLRAAA
jgi:hypothetical protein